MVRGLVWTFVIFCVFISLIVGTMIWLFYSSAGADFVLTRLSRHLNDRLEISRIEGSLARGLSVKGLTYTENGVSLTAASIHAAALISDIYPLEINFPVVKVEDLVVVTAADAPDDDQPFSFAVPLPQLPTLVDLIQITVADLSLDKITLQQGDEVTFVDDVQISGRLSRRKLLLDDFRLFVNEVSVVATLSLDLAVPTLDVSTTLTHGNPENTWKRLDLDLHLHETMQKNQAGTIGIKGLISDFPPFSLDTGIYISDQTLQFDNLALRQSERDGSIQASGQLRLDATGPLLDTQVHFHNLDLSTEADMPLWLSGLIDFSYGQSRYQGRLDLTSTGSTLTDVAMSANFSGNHQQLDVEQLSASWLAARIAGRLQVDWATTLKLAADADISDLSLDPFVPNSNSVINARLHATYHHQDDNPQAEVRIELIDSFVHDYPLSGTANAVYMNNNLILNRLTLHSNSAHLQAQGDLLTRLDFSLALDRLADFYPQADASLKTQGWLRKTEDFVEADLHVDIRQLTYDQWTLAGLSGHLALDAEQNLTAALSAENLGSDALQIVADRISLTTAGTLADHQINLKVENQETALVASITGNWEELRWNAVLESLSFSAAKTRWRLREATAFVVSSEKIAIYPMVLEGGASQSIHFYGEYLPTQNSLEGDLSWKDLSLQWFEKWTGPLPVQGLLDGQIALSRQSDQTRIAVSMLSVADLHYQKLFLQDTETRLTLHWGPDGLDADLHLDIGKPADLRLRVRSPQAAGFYLPERIDSTLACGALPLQLIQPWLPDELSVQGEIDCDIRGSWHGKGTFTGSGTAAITAGMLLLDDGEQAVDVALNRATLELNWQKNGLSGQVTIEHNYGHIHGAAVIGLEPRLPVTMTRTVPLSGTIDLLLRENSLLSVFFPQHLYDSKGNLELALTINGTVGEPAAVGHLSLTETEFYLPAAGIRLADVAVAAQLQGQQLEVSSLQLTSGRGTIRGKGRANLHGWKPSGYELHLSGKDFHLIDLNDLSILINPDLVVTGSLDSVRVAGSIYFPQAMIRDPVGSQTIRNSPDLVIVDRRTPLRQAPNFHHDIDVNLILGEQVLLDTAGLEARLGGSLRLYSDPRQQFAAQGRLFVVRGRFSTYGVSLDIERGDLYFAGVPLRYPALNILALRRVGEVRAGVRVTGTPQEPDVALYSTPTMPDTDVLSYIVLGRPLGSRGGDTDLLMVATGALLSQGESIILQERLKGHLGLDVLEFSGGDGEVSDAVITTGKHITPDLYVSLGYSLFNNSSEINIRYRLSTRLELESSLGHESGVDLFYRLEMDRLLKR